MRNRHHSQVAAPVLLGVALALLGPGGTAARGADDVEIIDPPNHATINVDPMTGSITVLVRFNNDFDPELAGLYLGGQAQPADVADWRDFHLTLYFDPMVGYVQAYTVDLNVPIGTHNDCRVIVGGLKYEWDDFVTPGRLLRSSDSAINLTIIHNP